MSIEDLTAGLLIKWNNKVISEGYTKSFDFYVKMEYPKSYKKIIEDVKYYEWGKKID